MTTSDEKPAPKLFDGQMLRACCKVFGWMVSFDGRYFFRVSEMPKLSNVARMEEEAAAAASPFAPREFFADDEVETVVSNRRRDTPATATAPGLTR